MLPGRKSEKRRSGNVAGNPDRAMLAKHAGEACLRFQGVGVAFPFPPQIEGLVLSVLTQPLVCLKGPCFEKG